MFVYIWATVFSCGVCNQIVKLMKADRRNKDESCICVRTLLQIFIDIISNLVK
jgi:hypothetical protein